VLRLYQLHAPASTTQAPTFLIFLSAISEFALEVCGVLACPIRHKQGEYQKLLSYLSCEPAYKRRLSVCRLSLLLLISRRCLK
jgi:hypothetical protein